MSARLYMSCARACAAAALCAHALAAPAHAQSVSAWIDANAAHSRPPSGAAVDAASYGLLGLRVRADGRSASLEAGATTGRGVQDGSGGWLSGRATLDASRAAGLLDFGVRAEATGLTYLDAVQLSATDEYTQTLAAGTLKPYAGVSIGGFRIGAEGVFTRGLWRSELSTATLPPGPALPLPGGNRDVQRRTDGADGEIRIIGGSAAVLRVIGRATVEVRASSFEAVNQVADGRYTGVDGTVALALGPLDVSAGVRQWTTPLEQRESGGHAGVGVALGSAAYVQAAASRSVADPLYGAAGDVAMSVGVSLRLGRRTLGPPAPATVGAPSGVGRVVRFTFRRADARSVAVAGDFSAWEPRTMQRGADGTWTLETVLAPGVYHYSFIVNGDTWTVPENATGLVDDGFGQKNATLVVNAEDR